MDIAELRERIERLAFSLDIRDQELLQARLGALISVYPFNEFEYCLTFLLDRGIVSFGVYESLRECYVSSNSHLGLFELAPRTFGETWGHQHIMDLDIRFKKGSRAVDASYEGQYDLWIEGARVEVKAARSIDTKKRDSLVSKALRYGSDEPFWMNYQQLKPDACDVFIFIGVWIDQVRYWVLSSEDVVSNEYLSHQHRGGIEYQIGITHHNIMPSTGFWSAELTLARPPCGKHRNPNRDMFPIHHGLDDRISEGVMSNGGRRWTTLGPSTSLI